MSYPWNISSCPEIVVKESTEKELREGKANKQRWMRAADLQRIRGAV